MKESDNRIERFDQKNDMFRRCTLEPEWQEQDRIFRDSESIVGKPGYSHEGFALTDAAWYVEDYFGKGSSVGVKGTLYSPVASDEVNGPLATREKIKATPKELTKKIKRVAKIYGASLVGVAEIREQWLYSKTYSRSRKEHLPVDLPEDMGHVIAIAIEMDYDLIQTAPSNGSAAAAGLGYSKMAFISGMVSKFIREIGYDAYPCGNGTALSIPIAIDAGLGELGRNGLLITEKYGPRVRICKIFTNMPLVPDKPVSFGVKRFCDLCKKCARYCPSKSISFDEMTNEGPTISNNNGPMKWYVNPESCFRFWCKSKTDCGVCIRVCPFNQKSGFLHNFVRFFIKHLPFMNRLFLSGSYVFGFGKRKDPSSIWDNR